MRTGRKILAILLAAVMLLSFAACTPGGEIETAPPESTEPSVESSTASTEPSEEPTEQPQSVSWEYEDGVLTISGEGAVGNYKDGIAPWAEYSDEITELVIGDGITSIVMRSNNAMDGAFMGLGKLQSVDIGEGVTSIDSWAFYGLGNLRSVSGGENVTEVGFEAFAGTPWRESGSDRLVTLGSCLIRWGNEDHEEEVTLQGITYVCNGAFLGEEDDYVSTLIFPGDVQINSGSFYVYDDDYDNPLVDIKTLIINGDAIFFGGSGTVSTVTVGGDAQIRNGAFQGADKLTDVTIGGDAKISLAAFDRCPRLETITVNGELAIGGYAFSNSGLNTINCERITEIGSRAFEKTPFIGYFDGDLLTLGSFIVKARPGIEKIDIPEGITGICAEAFSECTQLSEVTGGANVERVGYDAFLDTPWLNSQTDEFVVLGKCLVKYNGAGGSVVLPDNITGIGGYAFYDYDEITSLTFSNRVKSIEKGAFSYCRVTDVYFDGTEDELYALGDSQLFYDGDLLGEGPYYPFENSTIHYTTD